MKVSVFGGSNSSSNSGTSNNSGNSSNTGNSSNSNNQNTSSQSNRNYQNQDGIHEILGKGMTNGSAQTSCYMHKSETKKFGLMVNNKAVSSISVKWSSSNKSVATISSSGSVKVKKAGSTTITAEYKGKKYKCVIHIEENYLKFTSSTYLKAGENLTINCDLSKNSSFNLEVWENGVKVLPNNYSNSNSAVATWNGTKVTVKKEGKTTFTVSYGGQKVKCTIVVTNSHSNNSANSNNSSGTGSNTQKTKKEEKEVPSGGATVTAKSIKINHSSLKLKIGESRRLSVTFTPSNVSDKTIYWSSSNSNVAKVDITGNVKALKSGTAKITGRYRHSDKTVTCQVTVWQPIKSISLNTNKLSIKVGQTYDRLKASISPSNATDKRILWVSLNNNIATVKDGKITAKKAGTTTINAQAKDGSGKKATCTVTVWQAVTKIDISKKSLTLKKGQTYKLSATAYPKNAKYRYIFWSSSNTSVATVNNSGKITAHKAGKATIRAKTLDGSSVKCEVKVTQSVERVKLNKYYVLMKKGDSYKLKASVEPSSATNKDISWSSTNSSVAKVSKGKVKAKGVGSATITAKAKDGSGKKANCLVQVQAVKVSKISVTSSIHVNKGSTKKISYSVSPSNASNKKVSWSSRDSSIASVSNGKVTGKKSGHTWITVKAKDGSGKCARCYVIVDDPKADMKARRGK